MRYHSVPHKEDVWLTEKAHMSAMQPSSWKHNPNGPILNTPLRRPQLVQSGGHVKVVLEGLTDNHNTQRYFDAVLPSSLAEAKELEIICERQNGKSAANIADQLLQHLIKMLEATPHTENGSQSNVTYRAFTPVKLRRRKRGAKMEGKVRIAVS